jgi:hypothetical protein
VGENVSVIGAILIAIVLVVVLPAVFWAVLGVLSLVLGQLLTIGAERAHEGSELIDTNV